MTTLEKVKSLDDFKALRLFRHIEMEMVQKVHEDLGKIVQNLPEEVRRMPEIQHLNEVDDNKFTESLESETAVVVARQSLEYMALNPDTEAYIKDKLENWQDNEMVAGTILAVGGALSAVMIMSTFRISYNNSDGWQFSLGTPQDQQPEMIKNIFGTLLKLLKPV